MKASENLNLTFHFEDNQTQPDYQVRREDNLLIVPVVMMTEGVRSGSGGPILHLAKYFSQNVNAWNGAPVTAGHPIQDGGHVSVNEVDKAHWVVGYLRNARVEDNKLKADAYIDQQRAIAVNPEVLNYINEGKKLEVSIGAFTGNSIEEGQYDGWEYNSVTVSYQPDHLALLPGSRGACSWSDGCGIRVNENKEDKEDKMSNNKNEKLIVAYNGLQNNKMGFVELSRSIQSKLDKKDSDTKFHYLSEVYDSYFVFQIKDKNSGTQNYYKQEYKINDAGEIQITGSPVQVKRKIEYVPIQSSEECGCDMVRTKYTNNNNSNKEEVMSDTKKDTPSGEVMDKVSSLVNNEQTRFTKSDRNWLLQLNEDQLRTLEPTDPPKPEVNREDAIQVLQEDLQDIEKVKELVPESIKEQIELGLKAYQDERDKLIESIQTNTSKEDWPEETLKEMETDVLQRLEKTTRKTDFSGNGPIVNSSGDGEEEEKLLPAGVKIK